MGTSPREMCIMGPYTVANTCRRWCGGVDFDASWCKFPMMGNFGGPGGKFSFLLCDFNEFMIIKMGITRMKIRDISHEVSILRIFEFSLVTKSKGR